MDAFEQWLEENKNLIRQIWESGYIAGAEKFARLMQEQKKQISDSVCAALSKD